MRQLRVLLPIFPVLVPIQAQELPELEVQPLATRVEAAPGVPRFELLAAAVTGLDFENRVDWEHPRRHLYAHAFAGGGVAVGDYDGDGLPDLFFTSQTGRDRLFRQVEPFRFVDATDAAGLPDESDWGAGALFCDLDGDRRLDLYVCNVGAPNRAYMGRDGGRFEERAAALGLDFAGASVMAAPADYDGDGDLDLFLLTNRVYPPTHLDEPRWVMRNGRRELAPECVESFALQSRFDGGVLSTHVVQAGQRDRLYRNEAGTFREVALEAGIEGNFLGLSSAWFDYDDDGRPDLYVANDSWDPDRLYHNEGEGRFRDVARDALPSTTWFSMGSDSGDVDGDGRLDLLVADMSATTHFQSKLMMGDMGDSRWFLTSAEPRQAMRNHLFVNSGTERFLEAARLAHLASSDWTWSVRLGDLDDDGALDAFFTNGSLNHTFDPDFVRRLAQLTAEQEAQGLDPAAREAEQFELYRAQPLRRERNVARRNAGELDFEDVGADWGLDALGLSYGAALSDLDRDGDLDVVVNEADGPALVYRNGGAGRAALVELHGAGPNVQGVGARVELIAGGRRQVREVQPTRGFMSSGEGVLHFGLAGAEGVTKLVVRWPSGHVQRFDDLPADHRLIVHEPIGFPTEVQPLVVVPPLLEEAARELGIDVGARKERPFDDYAREPLLPMALSQQGPGLAFGDADGDGDDDLFVGGAAGWPGLLFVNEGGQLELRRGGAWQSDAACEDTAVLWIDVDGDLDQDLYVGSGGVECEAGDAVLRDRLYVNEGGLSFRAAPEFLPEVFDSTGAVCAADCDGDGDLDLFVGARSVPGRYPVTPASRLFLNDGGQFTDRTGELAPGLAEVGLVTSALWTDVTGDGRPELVVACEWGPVHLFTNVDGALREDTAAAGLGERSGWWSGLESADLDADGDLDLVALNAGLNTKYHADREHPTRLYYGEFEEGVGPQLIEAKLGKEHELPVRGRSCSSAAMPFIAEKMPDFRSFAGAALDEIYERAQLDEALALEADTLASGVYWNEGVEGGVSRFTFEELPRRVQLAPGYGVAALDLDADGHLDLVLVQNNNQREPETGRWNGGMGLVLRGRGGRAFELLEPVDSGFVVPGDGTALALGDVDGDGRPELAVGQNDAETLLFRSSREPLGVPLAVRPWGPLTSSAAVGLRARLVGEGFEGPWLELHAGSGAFSQSTNRLFLGRPAAPGELTLEVRWPDGALTEHSVAADLLQLDVKAPDVGGW